MQKMSTAIKVNPNTIRTVAHTNLQLRSFVKTLRHLLTDAMKGAKKYYLLLLHRHGQTVKIFLDEKKSDPLILF